MRSGDSRPAVSRHTAVVGKPDRPSPEIQSKIVEVNFNPYWTVPVSIVRRDLIPKMKAEVLCCVADNDDKRDPTAKDKLKKAFAEAHLKATIEASGAELVLIGTPIDLRKLIDFDVPALRVTYKLQEVGEPTLADVLRERGLIGDKALV